MRNMLVETSSLHQFATSQPRAPKDTLNMQPGQLQPHDGCQALPCTKSTPPPHAHAYRSREYSRGIHPLESLAQTSAPSSTSILQTSHLPITAPECSGVVPFASGWNSSWGFSRSRMTTTCKCPSYLTPVSKMTTESATLHTNTCMMHASCRRIPRPPSADMWNLLNQFWRTAPVTRGQ